MHSPILSTILRPTEYILYSDSPELSFIIRLHVSAQLVHYEAVSSIIIILENP